MLYLFSSLSVVPRDMLNNFLNKHGRDNDTVLFDLTFASSTGNISSRDFSFVFGQASLQSQTTVRQYRTCVSSRVFTFDIDLVTINKRPAFVSLSEENVTVMSQIFDLKQNIHVKINLFLILVFIDHCHISFPINNV